VSILYYGDNIDVLREHIKSESVDLIYLDPPFNSKRNYNLLFKSPEGEASKAQVTAFEDTWVWGDRATIAFDEVIHSGYAGAAAMLNAMHSFLGESDVMAYLSMMAVRLIELHRVLKPTGTIYLHCDPTASHYLKILMDGIFESENFRNEIVWCYAGGGIPQHDFPRKHDVILRYAKATKFYYRPIFRPYSPGTIQRGRTKIKGKYFDEGLRDEGTPVNDWWPDVPKITSPTDPEKLGYPTQKPLALLSRIITSSSKKNDLVLDPFCGCGTTVDAAEHLGRRWIGIDITHLAVGLIERRLKARYPDIKFEIRGMPRDIDGLRAMAEQARSNPRLYYELQYWAINQIPAAQHAQNQKKGADKGIDGIVWLRLGNKGTYEKALISVKAGDNVSVQMIRDLRGTIERDKAKLGVFLTLAEPTKPMRAEAAAAGLADLEGVKCPRIQILTFEDLLNGKQPQLPYADYALALPKAKQAEVEQGKLF
jgi:DNA modification methylase